MDGRLKRKRMATPAAPGTPKTPSERERAYAHAALDGCADELAQAAPGERNDTLNKKAFRLGTMVARGWISPDEVFDALLAAADACGLNGDDGEEQTRKTIQSGLENGKKFPHPDLSPTSGSAQSTATPGSTTPAKRRPHRGGSSSTFCRKLARPSWRDSGAHSRRPSRWTYRSV